MAPSGGQPETRNADLTPGAAVPRGQRDRVRVESPT